MTSSYSSDGPQTCVEEIRTLVGTKHLPSSSHMQKLRFVC